MAGYAAILKRENMKILYLPLANWKNLHIYNTNEVLESRSPLMILDLIFDGDVTEYATIFWRENMEYYITCN